MTGCETESASIFQGKPSSISGADQDFQGLVAKNAIHTGGDVNPSRNPKFPDQLPDNQEKTMNSTTPACALRRLFATATCLALTAALPAVSHASGALDERSVTLEFPAASATTTQGAGVLYRRIDDAARQICSVVDHGDVSSKRIFRNCLRVVIQNAVVKVNRPALTDEFEANYPPAAVRQLASIEQR
jgi:UrcA family protein